MSESRRSEFVRRLSSVGWGARESIQVLLAHVVTDVREAIVKKQYGDADMDEVVAFHDAAEQLWKDAIATNPPLERAALRRRLQELLQKAEHPALAEFERRIERGVRMAERFADEET